MTRDRRGPAVIAIGLAGALIALAFARIVGGWTPLAPDDARYLFVGLSVLDGHGSVTPSGVPYLLRSPVYGTGLAIGSRLVGGDPLIGARAVALAVSLLGLIGAVRLAWLAAGPGGAVATTVALAATPLLWQLVPSLRIDLPQTALVIAVLVAAWRPTTRRWALAGVLLGAAVLVKETVLPLVFLFVVLIGVVPRARLGRLALAYVGAAVCTAAWWWIVVWVSIGQVFPVNAFAVVEARDVEGALRLPLAAVPLIAVFAASWAIVAIRARRELGARLLFGAGVALAPAALYAASASLNARHYAGLAVLSAVAVGLTAAHVAAYIRRLVTRATADGSSRRAVPALVIAAVVVLAIAGTALGQRMVRGAAPDTLTDALVEWVAANVEDGGRIVMPFREREELALRRFGRTEVRLLGARRVDAGVAPETFLWIGLRGQQLFGYPRTSWVRALTDPPASYLLLVSPHPFTPTDLVGQDRGGTLPGLTPVATLEDGDDYAEILRIDTAGVRDGTAQVPLHLAAEAAMTWLDQAIDPDPIGRLLDARPVITGARVDGLLTRLGERACRGTGTADGVQLAPVGDCPA